MKHLSPAMRMMAAPISALVLVFLPVTRAYCQTGSLGTVALEPGLATAIDGTTMSYELGTLYVPENRSEADSRVISVGFARVKANHPTGAPPVFLLAGGPGLTMLDIVLGSDDLSRRRVKAWQAYSEVADLIVIEQRGYTLRGDLMEIESRALPLDQPMTTAQDIEITRDLAHRAQAAYPKADLSGYSIGEIADDVDSLRQALGYDRIALVAASFGSQWAFAVMKRHPGRVARAVISSAEPLDMGYDMPSQVFAAFQRIAVEADQDPSLEPYLPDGGLISAIQATRDRLAKGAVTVSVSDGEGRAKTVVLGVEDYQLGLITYSADASTFPKFVLSAYYGHYEDWAKDAIGWRAAENRSLINPLINIGLDMSEDRKRLLWTDPALPLIGSWNFAGYLATKGEWSTVDAGDTFRKPVLDGTAVLFVQGDWDTSTPLENTLSIAPYFPNSRTMILHRGQHNGVFALLRSRRDLTAKVYRFLRDGGLEDLPVEVDLSSNGFERPGFPPPAK